MKFNIILTNGASILITDDINNYADLGDRLHELQVYHWFYQDEKGVEVLTIQQLFD